MLSFAYLKTTSIYKNKFNKDILKKYFTHKLTDLLISEIEKVNAVKISEIKAM